MMYRYLLTLLGLGVMIIGLVEGHWFWMAVWLGSSFLALGLAHFGGLHGIFGKRSNGSLPMWSWIVFMPLHLCTHGLWHLTRLVSREPAYHVVSNDLVVGRRLLRGEIDGDFANYVDLTAEFSEPGAFRGSPAYFCFPILDGSAPDAEALRRAVNQLRPGRTCIHCAQGHGRTGLFALAVLLKSGAARTADDGLHQLQTIRPGINLSSIQRQCIDDFLQGTVP